jgi:hypothetical protein
MEWLCSVSRRKNKAARFVVWLESQNRMESLHPLFTCRAKRIWSPHHLEMGLPYKKNIYFGYWTCHLVVRQCFAPYNILWNRKRIRNENGDASSGSKVNFFSIHIFHNHIHLNSSVYILLSCCTCFQRSHFQFCIESGCKMFSFRNSHASWTASVTFHQWSQTT